MISKSDRKMAKEAVHEEKEAIRDYKKAKRVSKNPKVRKAFAHALKEEKQHAKMFKRAVKKRRT